MTKVFIDGSAGTTGLRIHERLSARRDIELILLHEDLRKDVNARREALNSADVAFLCLPDAAAKEAVGFLENESTAIIDTSTAHRTLEGWAYGFPELDGRRELIQNSKRIGNPGCHASGFIALVEPLVRAGIIDKSLALSAFSITGYSGGGKNMIAEYESDNKDEDSDLHFSAPRQYALLQEHKHLPEMMKVTGLLKAPIFSPVVSNFYSGMEVTVPVFAEQLSNICGKSPTDVIAEIYSDYYGTGRLGDGTGLVKYVKAADENGFLSAAAFSGRDDMEVTVYGNDERIILVARFDNLGKGASGAAIQNMNIILGFDEGEGLNY